jgi:GNAT superfamily N-acetyltransferase
MVGDDPVGALGLRIELDSALIPFWFVLEAHRRRGVASALLRAARVAARTRGVKLLHPVAPPDAAAFLRKLGFALDESPDALDASRTAAAQLLRWRLDISRDGIIVR